MQSRAKNCTYVAPSALVLRSTQTPRVSSSGEFAHHTADNTATVASMLAPYCTEFPLSTVHHVAEITRSASSLVMFRGHGRGLQGNIQFTKRIVRRSPLSASWGIKANRHRQGRSRQEPRNQNLRTNSNFVFA
jgi:hypothetical protein